MFVVYNLEPRRANSGFCRSSCRAAALLLWTKGTSPTWSQGKLCIESVSNMTKMFGSSDFCPVPVSKIIQFLSISARRADCTISAMEEVWINIRKLVLSWISAMEEVWITRLQRNAGLDRQEATRQKSSGKYVILTLLFSLRHVFICMELRIGGLHTSGSHLSTLSTRAERTSLVIVFYKF